MNRKPVASLSLLLGLILLGHLLNKTGEVSAQEYIEDVDRLFSAYDSDISPGCSLGIFNAGKIIYSNYYGMGNLESKTPISPQSLFNIGSIAKQFTAFSILLLAQAGKLSLEDDIRKFIPEMPDHGLISVSNLLHHTSGIRDSSELLKLSGWRTYDDLITNGDVLEVISKQKALNFEPGTESSYSNSNYFLLAIIVERVSSKSFSEFIKENILRPLSMNQTVVRNDHNMIVAGRVTGYIKDTDGRLNIGVSNDQSIGSGNLLSNIVDLAKWDSNFYNFRIGGRNSLNH